MMLLVKIIRGLFILVVVLSDVVLPQCQHPIRLDFRRTLESNQITFICRWCANISNVQDPHLFVNSTSTPLQFKRLDNGSLVFNISQELEGYYYCGASPNNISSNSKILIAYPRPRSSIPTQHSVEVGQTITIDCPIAVGALRELYSFSWRNGSQTLDTTEPETQYSVDPLSKSLTIANVRLDNNGTYYCDVTVSVPDANPYFVPEEYTKITLFVTEQHPIPSTTSPTLKLSLSDGTTTLSQLSTPSNTGSPHPSMTPTQPTTMSTMEAPHIIKIAVPTGLGVLIIVLGCVGSAIVCWTLMKKWKQHKPVRGKDRVLAPAQEPVSLSSGQQPGVEKSTMEQPTVGGEGTTVETRHSQNGTPHSKIQASRKGKRTPEYIVFHENYENISSTLIDLVAPNDLANKLYSAKLIGKDLKRQANRDIADERERIDNLLNAVHSQIELNCTAYQKFIEILEDYSQLEELLKSLKIALEVKVKQAGKVRTAAERGTTSIPVTTVQTPAQESVTLSSGQQPGVETSTIQQPTAGGEGATAETRHSQNGTPDPEVPTGEHSMSGKRTPEYIMFQKNCAMLSRTLAKHLSPDELANELFAAQLIVEGLKSEANNAYLCKTVRINNLLSAVHNQIELNPTVYQKFIEILEGYSQLEELLKHLRMKQAREVRITSDGGSDDEDEVDYAAADGGSNGEVQDCEEMDKVWMETSL